MMDTDKFQALHEAFREIDQELFRTGDTVHDTQRGIWGAASTFVCFELFKKINLEKYSSFLDLGCGDARIVLLASLFTKAVGIEYDPELIQRGRRIQEKLGLQAELIQGDYFDHDISGYDVVFINPDTGFYNQVEEKLLKELKGLLLNYNNTFLPRFLKQGKRHWIEEVPITEYVKKTDSLQIDKR